MPVPCVEIQLRDFEEAGYKADGSGKDAGGLQQGEICLRGPSIFKGYCASSSPSLNWLADELTGLDSQSSVPT